MPYEYLSPQEQRARSQLSSAGIDPYAQDWDVQKVDEPRTPWPEGGVDWAQTTDDIILWVKMPEDFKGRARDLDVKITDDYVRVAFKKGIRVHGASTFGQSTDELLKHDFGGLIDPDESEWVLKEARDPRAKQEVMLTIRKTLRRRWTQPFRDVGRPVEEDDDEGPPEEKPSAEVDSQWGTSVADPDDLVERPEMELSHAPNKPRGEPGQLV